MSLCMHHIGSITLLPQSISGSGLGSSMLLLLNKNDVRLGCRPPLMTFQLAWLLNKNKILFFLFVLVFRCLMFLFVLTNVSWHIFFLKPQCVLLCLVPNSIIFCNSKFAQILLQWHSNNLANPDCTDNLGFNIAILL